MSDELERLVQEVRDARAANAAHPVGPYVDDGAMHVYACGCELAKWPELDNEYCDEQKALNDRLRAADDALFGKRE